MAQKNNERSDRIEFDGTVIDALPGTLFKVQVENSESIVLCNLSGKLRMNKIRVLTGDKVKLEVSPYDMSRGRVTYRFAGSKQLVIED